MIVIDFHNQSLDCKSKREEGAAFTHVCAAVYEADCQHSRLRLQGLGPHQVVVGHDAGVQDAAVLVDPARGPPVPAAADDAEPVPLLERQLVLVPGRELPHGRVDGAALGHRLLRRRRRLRRRRARWFLRTARAVTASVSFSSFSYSFCR